MQAAVITFPGSNCDSDLIRCLQQFGGLAVANLFHKDTDLQGADIVFLPGGFSYGDYLRCGAIAKFAPIMAPLRNHADRGGMVVGICNGFQILTEAGLLPGVLRQNACGSFICENVWLRATQTDAPMAYGLDKNRIYKIPIAHAEGNYYADPHTLAELKANRQIVFQYCDEAGNPTPAACPNGALENIAGVCNQTRNVLGMMPHPERAASHIVGNTDGRAFFEGLLAHACVPA